MYNSPVFTSYTSDIVAIVASRNLAYAVAVSNIAPVGIIAANTADVIIRRNNITYAVADVEITLVTTANAANIIIPLYRSDKSACVDYSVVVAANAADIIFSDYLCVFNADSDNSA